MQYVNCHVFLSGDRNHSVALNNISVAEVVVLRHLHGSDAVHDIEPTVSRKANHNQVMDQLLSRYSTRARDIRETIFPGASPQLPTTLNHIGIDRADVKSRRAAKKEAEAETEEADESADESESEDANELTG